MKECIRKTFLEGEGIFKMVPNFIPCRFNLPGKRLKIHPDDYYAYGMKAGAIMERWFSSVNQTRAKNPDRPDQGLSYVVSEDGHQFLLQDAVNELKDELIGEKLWSTYGNWPIFAKFFDYRNPLFFHFHPDTAVAARVGCAAKPECYYFPPQLNNYVGERPSTYFGFNPEVTKDDVRLRIEHFEDYDTKITTLSRAYDLEIGTGWYIPAGVLHAPGSLLTYEPQWSTDLNCVVENVVWDEIYDKRYLTDICPEGIENEVDYIMDAVDWDANYDENFKEHFFRPPVILGKTQEGLTEKWICYGNEYVTAKEVTIAPQSEVVLKDNAAYGCVIVQGFGKFGVFDAEAVNLMRVGQLTADEYFVSCDKAKEGVVIINKSHTEPMVILQHFGPDNAIYI